jgi:hypothetical protein
LSKKTIFQGTLKTVNQAGAEIYRFKLIKLLMGALKNVDFRTKSRHAKNFTAGI